MDAPALEALCDEDGHPWGVYAYGHIDPATITLEAINAALAYYCDADPIKDPAVQHLWMHQDPEAGEDYPFHWCDADTLGAIAVTGVKF